MAREKKPLEILGVKQARENVAQLAAVAKELEMVQTSLQQFLEQDAFASGHISHQKRNSLIRRRIRRKK